MLTSLLLVFLHATFLLLPDSHAPVHRLIKSPDMHLFMPPDSSFYHVLQAYQLATANHNPQELGNAAFRLGMEYYSKNQYEKALHLFEEAEAIAKKIKDNVIRAQALDKMAAIYRKKGVPSQALPLQRMALHSAKTARKREYLISFFRNLGYNYWLLQEYDSALHYYQQRITICAEIGSLKNLVEANSDVANLLYNLSMYEACIPYYEQIRKLNTQSNNKANFTNAYSYLLAHAYTRISAHQKGYDVLFTTIPFLQKSKNYKKLVTTYSTLGTISLQLTNLNEAVHFFEKSLQLSQTINNAKETANSFLNLGIAYLHLKNYLESLKYLFASQRISNQNNLRRLQAYTHDNLGRVYLALEQTDSALYHYHKALEIRQSIARPPHPNLADVHTELGKAYLALGDYKKTQHHIQESTLALGVLEDEQSLPLHEIPPPNTPISGEEYLDLMRLKGEYLSTAFADTAAWEAGLRHYEAGIHFLLNAYVYVRELEQSKLAWLTFYRGMFEEALEVAHRLYENTGQLAYLERAFALVEQNKALLLRQSLQEAQAKASANLPDSLRAREQSFRQKTAQKETELLQARQAKDSAQTWEVRTELIREREQYFRWIEKMEGEYPEYYQLKYVTKPVTMQAIRQQLPPGTGLVNYFLGEKHLFLFGITQDTLLSHQYTLPAGWHSRLKNYRQALNNHDTLLAHPEKVQQTIVREGQYFYQTLVAPFLDNTQENLTKLIVVPDGELNLLPFSVLLIEQPRRLHYGSFPYLLNKLSVQYTYSANLYFQAKPAAAGPDKQHAFGSFAADYSIKSANDSMHYPHVPEAQLLAQEAAGIMKGKVWKNSLKSTFLKQASRCKIIHFGGHAIAETDNLSNNRLVFQSGSTQGLYLYLPEIYNLNLQGTELVVLSGCNTGTGAIKNGEGVISTARGFQYAGAHHVLLSVNAISDAATRQLLKMFYANLDNGSPIEEALRLAKQQYLEKHKDDPLLSHPLYWASILTFGDGTPGTIATQWEQSKIIVVVRVLFVLIGGSGLFWVYRKKYLNKPVKT